MVLARWFGAAAVLLAAMLSTVLAAAESSPQLWRSVRVVGTHPIVAETSWAHGGGAAPGSVSLRSADQSLLLARGGWFRTSLAARGNTVLIAMASSDPGAGVRLGLVSVDQDGSLGKPVVVMAPRAASMDRTPTAIVACADPQGFTVLWQEQSGQALGEAVTFFARLDEQGHWLVRPKQVPVPWALGAVVHNGDGYHLAIFFDGARPDQSRLCAVRLTAEGQPREHPWWVSEPQLVDEVQLVASGTRVLAYFRGGPTGNRLQSTDLSEVRSWATPPPPAQIHAELSSAEEFTLRQQPDGTIQIVRYGLRHP